MLRQAAQRSTPRLTNAVEHATVLDRNARGGQRALQPAGGTCGSGVRVRRKQC